MPPKLSPENREFNIEAVSKLKTSLESVGVVSGEGLPIQSGSGGHLIAEGAKEQFKDEFAAQLATEFRQQIELRPDVKDSPFIKEEYPAAVQGIQREVSEMAEGAVQLRFGGASTPQALDASSSLHNLVKMSESAEMLSDVISVTSAYSEGRSQLSTEVQASIALQLNEQLADLGLHKALARPETPLGAGLAAFPEVTEATANLAAVSKIPGMLDTAVAKFEVGDEKGFTTAMGRAAERLEGVKSMEPLQAEIYRATWLGSSGGSKAALAEHFATKLEPALFSALAKSGAQAISAIENPAVAQRLEELGVKDHDTWKSYAEPDGEKTSIATRVVKILEAAQASERKAASPGEAPQRSDNAAEPAKTLPTSLAPAREARESGGREMQMSYTQR